MAVKTDVQLKSSLDSAITTNGLQEITGAILNGVQTDIIDSKVSMTDAETIAGVKTFSSSPIVPVPTTNSQAANKQYVDGAIPSVTGFVPYTDATAGLDLGTHELKSALNRQTNAYHTYGGFNGKSQTITIASSESWSWITNATNNLWTELDSNGITLSDDILTFANDGSYVGSLSISFSGVNGRNFLVRIYDITTSTQNGYLIGCTTTGTSNYVNLTLPLYIEAKANDTFRFEITCEGSGATPIVRTAVYTINYLHD